MVENERIRINIHGKELYGVSNEMRGLDLDGDGIPDVIDGEL